MKQTKATRLPQSQILDAALKSKIRMLHAQGYTAQEIARRIRVNSAMTRIFMNRLKLDATPTQRAIQKAAAALPDAGRRYDAPGEIVIERAREFVTYSRPASVFSMSSLL